MLGWGIEGDRVLWAFCFDGRHGDFTLAKVCICFYTVAVMIWVPVVVAAAAVWSVRVFMGGWQ